MKAVNLIPSDSRRAGRGPSLGGRNMSLAKLGAPHAVIAVLAVALAFAVVYVLESNTVSQRRAQLSTLRGEVAQTQAQAARLTNYVKFENLAAARARTVREIASTRFDWHAALSDLSKVMPAHTALQSLVATVSPTSSVGGGSSSAGAVRGDIDSPAFELRGCTGTQDEVAQLMSRLRLINGVTRVTLETSNTAGGAPSGGSSSGSGVCDNGPMFDLVVFFQPVTPLPASTGSTS
jgi:Tfp pilus assembly protein PilN